MILTLAHIRYRGSGMCPSAGPILKVESFQCEFHRLYTIIKYIWSIKLQNKWFISFDFIGDCGPWNSHWYTDPLFQISGFIFSPYGHWPRHRRSEIRWSSATYTLPTLHGVFGLRQGVYHLCHLLFHLHDIVSWSCDNIYNKDATHRLTRKDRTIQ